MAINIAVSREATAATSALQLSCELTLHSYKPPNHAALDKMSVSRQTGSLWSPNLINFKTRDLTTMYITPLMFLGENGEVLLQGQR